LVGTLSSSAICTILAIHLHRLPFYLNIKNGTLHNLSCRMSHTYTTITGDAAGTRRRSRRRSSARPSSKSGSLPAGRDGPGDGKAHSWCLVSGPEGETMARQGRGPGPGVALAIQAGGRSAGAGLMAGGAGPGEGGGGGEGCGTEGAALPSLRWAADSPPPPTAPAQAVPAESVPSLVGRGGVRYACMASRTGTGRIGSASALRILTAATAATAARTEKDAPAPCTATDATVLLLQ
jgi:hypothetical protein